MAAEVSSRSDPPIAAMGSPRRDQACLWNLTMLDDRRAPDDETDEPLPFEPDLAAARDVDGPTQGELRRRPGKDAGEENQEPGDGWEGA